MRADAVRFRCDHIAWRTQRDCLHGEQHEARPQNGPAAQTHRRAGRRSLENWKREREMREATVLGLLLWLASCNSHSGQETGASPIESLVKQVVPPGFGGGCGSPTTDTYSASITCDQIGRASCMRRE